MKDALLIDTWNRAFRNRCGSDLIRAAEYNVYIADDGAKALQMLRTAAMDAVIINLHGPEEDETGLVARIARAHPRVNILFMPASGRERMLSDRLESRGLIQCLGEYLRSSEVRQGRELGLCCAGPSDLRVTSRLLLE